MWKAKFMIQGLSDLVNKKSGHGWKWRYGRKKLWMNKTINAFILAGYRIPDKPISNYEINITRHSEREPDHDNLPSCAKDIIDGLVKNHVLYNDDPASMKICNVFWKFAKKSEGFMEINIRELR